jgi:hypothetical protein
MCVMTDVTFLTQRLRTFASLHPQNVLYIMTQSLSFVRGMCPEPMPSPSR